MVRGSEVGDGGAEGLERLSRGREIGGGETVLERCQGAVGGMFVALEIRVERGAQSGQSRAIGVEIVGGEGGGQIGGGEGKRFEQRGRGRRLSRGGCPADGESCDGLFGPGRRRLEHFLDRLPELAFGIEHELAGGHDTFAGR